MKKTLIIFSFALLSMTVFSQSLTKEQVPQAAKDMVQIKFPQTVDIPVTWAKEKANFKASFTIMETPAIMVVDSLGQIIRIERRIHETYLPAKAKDHLKKLDSGYEIVNIMQVTDDKGKVTYKTVARVKTDFIFDGDGNLKK